MLAHSLIQTHTGLEALPGSVTRKAAGCVCGQRRLPRAARLAPPTHWPGTAPPFPELSLSISEMRDPVHQMVSKVPSSFNRNELGLQGALTVLCLWMTCSLLGEARHTQTLR